MSRSKQKKRRKSAKTRLDYRKLSVKVALIDDWCCFASARKQRAEMAVYSFRRVMDNKPDTDALVKNPRNMQDTECEPGGELTQ
jgi:hypothetical protein